MGLMGCDIHCYIEFKDTGFDSWNSFGGRINPGRNYRIFAKLAGVRNYDEVTPVIDPRGYPLDTAYCASDDYWIYVTDDDSENSCTISQAEGWVANGSSVFRNEKKHFVSNPDWHSHSWMTLDEYLSAISGLEEPKYNAIAAAMKSFKEDGCDTRLVFWFDN